MVTPFSWTCSALYRVTGHLHTSKGIPVLIEQQMTEYAVLNRWFQSDLGRYVASELISQFKKTKDYLKGDTLLQLGCCGDNPWLALLHFNRQWIASPFFIEKKGHIQSALQHLPLARNSVDCIIAPFTLEPFGTRLAVIDEMDRVLKPMGHAVLFGLNPWSLWGLAMKCGLLDCFQNHRVTLRTALQINRIFLQRGYQQRALTSCCYIPPVKNHKIIEKLKFLDKVGDMLWPYPSGFYFYVAQKHEPISPSRRSLVDTLREHEIKPSFA